MKNFETWIDFPFKINQQKHYHMYKVSVDFDIFHLKPEGWMRNGAISVDIGDEKYFK